MFIFPDTEASLAEYLMKNMKSRDGKPLLTNIFSTQMLQMSKDIVTSFAERYFCFECMHKVQL